MSVDIREDAGAYWQGQFDGGLEVGRFPAHFQGERAGGRAAVRAPLSQNLHHQLLEATQGSHYSLLVFLLSGVSAVLNRYTGLTDMLIGTTAFSEEWTEGMASVIPVRCRLDEGQSFKSLLMGVHESLADAQPMGSQAQLSTIVLLENIQDPHSEETSGAHLIFRFSLKENGLNVMTEYDSALYGKQDVERILEHLDAYLLGAMADADAPHSRVSLLTDSEREKVLLRFNNTQADYDKRATIHELFEQQAIAHGGRPAVVCGQEVLTYGELNRLANGWASLLRSKGVARQSVVGIMVKPSFEMIIGLLAILKSGGTFVPIDPDYPQARIDYILSNSEASVLLTQTGLADSLAYSGEVIILDGDAPSHDSNLVSVSTADDTAYVVYTSGTTGEPKGVMISHRSLHNLCAWHNRNFEVTEHDRSTKYAGFGFDASVWEVFPYLLAGASLCIIPDHMRLDVHKLHQHFAEQGVTISFLPTPLFEKFVALPDLPLRKLLTGGDALRYAPGKSYQLINNYGPSENTVVATSCIVDGGQNPVPIGKPIDNTQIYILDGYDGLQPVGVPGELCLSGDGIAKGYINNEPLTRSKFVPNPFRPGSTLYRTGDKARWLPDGNIEFLGRVDDQVKIRGVRIELQEIEKQLLKHADVSNCCVIVTDPHSANARLVAFYEGQPAVPPAELKQFLSLKLPDVMVPGQFVHMDRIPLTPNGKADKKALRVPAAEPAHSDADAAAAFTLTETESYLVQLWQSVLGIERVTIDDNFFEVGGNSLLLVEVHAQLEQHVSRSIAIADLFAYTTIRQIAAFLDDRAVPQGHKWSVDGHVLVQAKALAEGQNISIQTLLLSAYLYVLQEATEQPHLQVKAHAGTEWADVSVSFEEIDDFGSLFARTQAQLTQPRSAADVPASAPCFSYRGASTTAPASQGGLRLDIVEQDGELQCTLSGGDGVSLDQRKAFASMFTRLLEALSQTTVEEIEA